MKIATFNANSIRARMDIVIQWLDRHDPDLLCIQETKVRDEEFPLAPFEEAGYRVTFRGEKSYNGVAVISKQKPDKVRCGFEDGESADETRLLYTKFGPLHVVNTYVPQGREIDHEMFKYKIRWLARLEEFFSRHFTPRMKVLWLGDLNVARDERDIHNAEKQANHVCYHDDARHAFEKTISWGFIDVFREFHADKGHYTFFDYRVRDAVKRGMGWRIDYLMATPSLARRCTEAAIDLEPRLEAKPSDHTFLVGEFDL